MNIKMTIAKDHRKALADMLAEKIGTERKYLGVPNCDHQVGAFTFHKDCTVTVEDGTDASPLTDILKEQGIVFEIEGNAEAETDSGIEGEPMELTIEMPRDFYTDAALSNLRKIVDSKASLIKKMTGADALPIEIGEDKISFPWFKAGNADETKAYSEFISKMSQMAKDAKRVMAKEKEVESEKYAMRCFLLRLGFSGGDHKTDRKILLRNLTGPAAFPTKAAADEFSEKQKAKRGGMA